MKKIYAFVLPLILSLITLTSCSDKDVKLKPSATEISGDLEGCFVVIDREYKVFTDEWPDGLITVEIERTDKYLPFDFDDKELWTFGMSGSAANVMVGFGIEYLDEDGNIVSKISADGAGFSGSYDPDESIALVKMKNGRTGTIRFQMPSDKDANIVAFRITSAFQENEETIDDSIYFDDEPDEDDIVEGISESKDWDALLDAYDSYVTKYISYMKKAAKGDMSALSEYPALMQKAQEFSDKMANAEGDMSDAQWARYIKITTKMTQAAAEM